MCIFCSCEYLCTLKIFPFIRSRKIFFPETSRWPLDNIIARLMFGSCNITYLMRTLSFFFFITSLRLIYSLPYYGCMRAKWAAWIHWTYSKRMIETWIENIRFGTAEWNWNKTNELDEHTKKNHKHTYTNTHTQTLENYRKDKVGAWTAIAFT